MARGKLTDEARTYVIRALACFIGPSEIVEGLRKDFGIDVTPQSVEGYDPTKAANVGMAKRWRDLFEGTRQAFIEEVANVGIAHRAVRLRTLERIRARAEKQGNLALVLQVTIEAEKITGELYTNKRVLTGANGKPLFPPKPITDEMTLEEAAEAYAATREALGQ